MKKNLGKFIVSCAAIMSVSAAMAISASAAVSYDAATTTVSNSETMAVASGKQATILVAAETDSALTEGDIYYIDQQKSDGSLPAAWQSIKVKALSDGNYVLKMGGEGVSPNSVPFTVGSENPDNPDNPDNPPVGGDTEERLLGDVVRDGAVDAEDALEMLYHDIELKTLTGDDFKLADITEDGTVDAEDALEALYNDIEVKVITKKITVTKK